MNARPVNFALIEQLSVRPHQHLNISCDHATLICEHGHDHEPGTGEVLQEARTVQHLCDLAGVPEGHGYAAHIDARVSLLVTELVELQGRLGAVAKIHERETGEGGLVGDHCVECGWRWPCQTRRTADGDPEILDEPIAEAGPWRAVEGKDRRVGRADT